MRHAFRPHPAVPYRKAGIVEPGIRQVDQGLPWRGISDPRIALAFALDDRRQRRVRVGVARMRLRGRRRAVDHAAGDRVAGGMRLRVRDDRGQPLDRRRIEKLIVPAGAPIRGQPLRVAGRAAAHRGAENAVAGRLAQLAVLLGAEQPLLVVVVERAADPAPLVDRGVRVAQDADRAAIGIVGQVRDGRIRAHAVLEIRRARQNTGLQCIKAALQPRPHADRRVFEPRLKILLQGLDLALRKALEIAGLPCLLDTALVPFVGAELGFAEMVVVILAGGELPQPRQRVAALLQRRRGLHRRAARRRQRLGADTRPVHLRRRAALRHKCRDLWHQPGGIRARTC